jgi:hypothetical protein
MDQATINRYQPGGDIYAQLVTQYGQTNADAIAQAAATGDRTQLGTALANVRDGAAPGSTSTIVNLYNQLTTDPLAAPLSDLNTIVGNSAFAFLKSPYVAAIALLALFFYFGGAVIITSWISKKAK